MNGQVSLVRCVYIATIGKNDSPNAFTFSGIEFDNRKIFPYVTLKSLVLVSARQVVLKMIGEIF